MRIRGSLIFCGLALAAVVASANPSAAVGADRIVMAENFTATWCGYCPPVRAGLETLLSEYPDSFNVINIHVSDGSYVCPWGQTRTSFCDVYYSGGTGLPTTWFEGTTVSVGAGTTDFHTHYNNAMSVPAYVSIELTALPLDSDSYTVFADVCMDEDGVPMNLRVDIIQTIQHYPNSTYNYWCQQGASPYTMTLNPGECVTVERQIDLDSTALSRINDVRIVAYARLNTAHPAAIQNSAFMDYPFPLARTLFFDIPGGVPDYLSPFNDTVLQVVIEDAGENYVDGSATLHYRYDGGTYLTSSLTALGGDLFEAVLPAPGCGGATPEFYITALGDEGGEAFLPEEAPAEVFSADVGDLVPIFADDFEADLGWTVIAIPDDGDGTWERAVPGIDVDRGAPPTDYDGSGYCYVTDNDDNDDVDLGPTILISPTFDLAGTTDPVFRFAYWWANDDQDGDPMQIDVSNDDGLTWIPAMTIANIPEPAWDVANIHLADVVAPAALSSIVKVRISVEDPEGSASKDEGAIDAVEVFDVTCGAAVDPGNMNCDDVVDGLDIAAFMMAMLDEAGYAAEYPGCNRMNGDFSGDSVLDTADVAGFAAALVGE